MWNFSAVSWKTSLKFPQSSFSEKMKCFVKTFVHHLSLWQDTSHLPFVFLLMLTADENSVICADTCGVMALIHQTVWLVGWAVLLAWREETPVLSQLQAKMAFSQTTHKKKRKEGKIANGTKHNAKSKMSVFLGSPSLASIIHSLQNPCSTLRRWKDWKIYTVCVYVCTIQCSSTTTDMVLRCTFMFSIVLLPAK